MGCCSLEIRVRGKLKLLEITDRSLVTKHTINHNKKQDVQPSKKTEDAYKRPTIIRYVDTCIAYVFFLSCRAVNRHVCLIQVSAYYIRNVWRETRPNIVH